MMIGWILHSLSMLLNYIVEKCEEISKRLTKYLVCLECFHSLQLVSSVDNRVLKLTQLDDDIYRSFRQHFPDLKVEVIDQDLLKSEAAKLVSGFLFFVSPTEVKPHSRLTKTVGG